MEQTLGKRIAQHRKRMNLTQDQLAEKLGITAQAVSKWENDLSCPDISMLPKLAEIFGITTDELLGREAPERVHNGEVVDEDDTAGVHIENSKGSWNFHWDSGRKHSLLFASCVIWVGGLTLASRILGWDASFWSILWPSIILFTGVAGSLRRFSVFDLACILFGGYYLVSNLGFWTLNITGELLFPICVVLFGAGLLIDALRKPRKPKFTVIHRGGDSSKTRCNCTNSHNRFDCDLSFGEKSHMVDLPVLAGGEANCSFGELTVDLTGCQMVAEACDIDANCSFGVLHLLVPRHFAVQAETSTAFASVDFAGQPDATPQGMIYLDANVSFGQITVRYI